MCRWAKAQRAASHKAREDTIRALVSGFQEDGGLTGSQSENVAGFQGEKVFEESFASRTGSSRALFLENANQALFPTSSRRDSDSQQSLRSTAFMTPEQVRGKTQGIFKVVFRSLV